MSCGDKAPATEKVVATTAKLYYDYLLEEKYDDFVEGIDLSFPKSETYKTQMRDCAKMFVDKQKQAHKGIKTVDAVNAEVDADEHSANADEPMVKGVVGAITTSVNPVQPLNAFDPMLAILAGRIACGRVVQF